MKKFLTGGGLCLAGGSCLALGLYIVGFGLCVAGATILITE